jgi:hypothetical protein
MSCCVQKLDFYSQQREQGKLHHARLSDVTFLLFFTSPGKNAEVHAMTGAD